MILDHQTLVAIAGAFVAVALHVIARRRIRSLTNRVKEIETRFEAAHTKAGRENAMLARLLAERERSLETAIRQTQTDMKRMEMQMRAPEREVSETVELAIHLARIGEDREHIMRRTGLPADIIETITALHAGRARH